MKKIIYLITGLLLTIVWLTACTEEGFTTFQGEKSGIYMANVRSTDINGNPITYADTIEFSFATYKSDVTKLTQSINVRLMGNTTDYDRTFILKVDETKSTAKRGTHFEFNDADCVLPANQSIKKVPITIFRTEDLATKKFRIEFYLEPNDHFTTELERYKNTAFWKESGTMLCGLRFKILFSEFYSEPGWWGIMSAYNFYGPWSVSKEKRLNSIMGWTHIDWENWKVPYGRMPFAAKLLRKELQALANAGTPVMDDDGKYMQLAGAYEVDYSAYEK